MILLWSARAIRDMAELAKLDRAAVDRLKTEALRYAANPVNFPQRGGTNFKYLTASRHEARLRVGHLRALMDRQGETWVVARVVRRSEDTYD
ncbi:MAG: type II toxin-antitoxin system RelE/ParE family toxin [Rhodospirillaceae bacterium]|nr:type II toxin-antitoxin system RelE/ParE family toxin [Rhodospirillaceae bacterium]